MDIFIGSAVCFIARNKYSRLCGLYRFPVIDSYHESQSESCRTKHESDNSHLEQSENKDEKNLSQNTPIVDWASIVQGILSAKPFIPAPYSVIDYHGQVSMYDAIHLVALNYKCFKLLKLCRCMAI